MRRFMPLVPALCTFGPLEMVIGFDSPFHVIAIVAALITAVGILIIFANVMLLIQASDPALNDAPGKASRANASILGLAILAVLLVAGIAFYMVSRTHH